MTRKHPIIFSAESVRAILAGRKTQTRRVVKPQPPEFKGGVHPNNVAVRPAPYIDAYCNELRTKTNPRGMGLEWFWWTEDNRLGPLVARCPFGRPGDRLWVREAFHWAGFTEDGEVRVRYVADETNSSGLAPDDAWLDRSFEGAWVRWSEDMEAAGYTANPDDGFFEWTRADRAEPTFVGRRVAPMFLPRWASRLTLEVVSVRVERLQAIDDDDVMVEGIGPCFGDFGTCDEDCRRQEYRAVWNALNAKRGHGWDENPWVWVVEFKKVEDER